MTLQMLGTMDDALRFKTRGDDHVNARRFQCYCFIQCGCSSDSDDTKPSTLFENISRWYAKDKAEYRWLLIEDHLNLVFK